MHEIKHFPINTPASQRSKPASLIVKNLGIKDYSSIFEAMKDFTANRTAETPDEFWCLEHYPVFTQGQAGKPEHILAPLDIPLIQTDRGGQVTYHGPGQLIVYFLVDVQRKEWGVRAFVSAIEQAVIDLLAEYSVKAHNKKEAPGVYVEDSKIASLGLRIRKGCSYHGLSFNINMDLEPFQRIHPCGFKGLKVVQLRDYVPSITIASAKYNLLPHLKNRLKYGEITINTFQDS